MDMKQAKLKARYLRQMEDAQRIRKANRWLGLGLTGMVFSIYFYSMYAIKQESIISEIDDEIRSK